jgi:hypothetical protein
MKRASNRRRFTLTLQAGPDETYGFSLNEARAANGESCRVAHVDHKRGRRLLGPLVESVNASGYPKTVLHAGRRDALSLREEDGVRLGLLMLATAPVSKLRRVDSMISGINAMTTEEAYYWYAKATGPDASRIRRSLRLFLAQD